MFFPLEVGEKKRKMEEGGRKVMKTCPDFEPRTLYVMTTGSVQVAEL